MHLSVCRRFFIRRYPGTSCWILAASLVGGSLSARAVEFGTEVVGLGSNRIEELRKQHPLPTTSRVAEAYAAQTGEPGVPASIVAAVPGVALATEGEVAADGPPPS